MASRLFHAKPISGIVGSGKIAQEHTLAGGSIMNVIRYASLEALKDGSTVIARDDVIQGIRREYAKEGKSG